MKPKNPLHIQGSITDKREVSIDLDDPEVQAAAIRIQATVRGYQTRKSITASRSLQAEMQSHFGGKLMTLDI